MAHHDVGGSATDAKVPMEQHAIMPWEVRVNALLLILADERRAGGPLMTVDQLRLGIESLTPEEYRDLGYFSKWLRSIAGTMVREGYVDRDELERRYHALHEEHAREHQA